jgi:hypothetical protein
MMLKVVRGIDGVEEEEVEWTVLGSIAGRVSLVAAYYEVESVNAMKERGLTTSACCLGGEGWLGGGVSLQAKEADGQVQG